MIFQPFCFDCGPLEANLYVLADEQSHRGLLIDAGVFDDSVLDFIRKHGIQIEAILLTHLHHDHVDGASAYQRALAAKVYSPASTDKASDVHLVHGGDQLDLAGFAIKVFKTSGHTPESITFYLPHDHIAFVGDAIFAGAVGGTSSDELHAEQITHIQGKLMTLPPQTELWSGHGPGTTVAIEKGANPFLQSGFGRTA